MIGSAYPLPIIFCFIWVFLSSQFLSMPTLQRLNAVFAIAPSCINGLTPPSGVNPWVKPGVQSLTARLDLSFKCPFPNRSFKITAESWVITWVESTIPVQSRPWIACPLQFPPNIGVWDDVIWCVYGDVFSKYRIVTLRMVHRYHQNSSNILYVWTDLVLRIKERSKEH